MTSIPAAVERWHVEKEALLAAYPDLADDPDTLRDTLEGMTDVHDIIGRLGRKALEDEASAAASKALGRTYQDRAERQEKRAERLRSVMLNLMRACDLKRVDRPEMTISRQATPASVIIPDPSAVPDEYCRIEKKPNRTVIKRLLEGGERVNFATLSEPGETVRITR